MFGVLFSHRKISLSNQQLYLQISPLHFELTHARQIVTPVIQDVVVATLPSSNAMRAALDGRHSAKQGLVPWVHVSMSLAANSSVMRPAGF